MKPRLALPEGPRARLLLAVQSLLLALMAASVATRLWQDHPWFGPLLIAVTVVFWAPELTRRRDRLAWFFYVAGTFTYTLLRSVADETNIPVRTEYVIDLDAALPGRSLVPLLQDWREGWDFRRAVDYLAIALHWSYFVIPHAAAIAIFVWRRSLFPLYAGLMVVAVWIGLGLFFLVPTVPPWLAGEQGDLPGVTRVMDTTVRDALGPEGAGATYDDLYEALGEPNSLAAMPSIHMAITFGIFLWAWKFARRFAPWVLAYTVLMGLALAYLGEHYIADELGGIAVAIVAWLVVLRFPALRPPQAAR